MKTAAFKDQFIIRLFGNVGIEDSVGNNVLNLPKKGWAILAYLIGEPNTSHTREKLAEIFWPSLSTKSARSNLRQVVLNIQRVLGEQHSDYPFLIADRQTIHINPENNYSVDLVKFIQDIPECSSKHEATYCDECIAGIEARMTLYRSEFMAGFYLDDCLEFDDWLQVNREALHRRALIMYETLSNHYEVLKDNSKALVFAQRYMELEPWNEEGQYRVMRLLAKKGQQGAALNQYAICCRLLNQELGTLPSKKTTQLAKQIQNGELQAKIQIQSENIPHPNLLSIAIEKRQVTVIYCQLFLDKCEDPEEAFEQLRHHQRQCVEIIQHFAGHIVWTNDGGLLVYFGYPKAREYAAQRAVTTALQLIKGQNANLKLRIGIHTGLIITSNNENIPDFIGKTSGMAIHLRKIADWGTIVVSATTQNLVAGYFSWHKLPPITLKNETGIHDEKRELFQVIRKTGITTRLEAADSLTPLIGRQSELDLLLKHWGKICKNECFQSLLISGDPGIGKSRLVHAIKQEIFAVTADVAVNLIELHSFPEFSQSPLYPVITFFKKQLRFTDGDNLETQFGKLLDYMSKLYSKTELNNVIPVFASLLELPLVYPYKETTASLKSQREQIMEIILQHLYRQAKIRPVLFVVEDLHWTDPSTLDLLSQLISSKIKRPIYALFTARTEFQASYFKAQLDTLNLEPLSYANIQTMIKTLGLDIPALTMDHIVKRADGIPLFAEELARVAEELAREVPLVNSNKSFAIPITLQDLLATRLDGMGTVKAIILLAATLGRKFSIPLLQELSLLDTADFQNVLEQFQSSGLFSKLNNNEYEFRHALFQDAVRNSQTRQNQQAAHKLIANTLEIRFSEIVHSQPEVIAQHWAAAGEVEVAIGYWIKAAKLTNHRCAYKEAISQLKAALTLLADFPDGERKDQLEFEVQIGLGVANFAIEGYASPDGVIAYSKALELGDQQSNSSDFFQALWGVWASSSSQANYPKAREYSQRLLEIASSKDPVELQEGHFAVGNTLYWSGEFSKAREHLQQAIALYKPEHHEQLITRFGENVYVTSCSYLSWILCVQGFPVKAQQLSYQAIAEARRIKHPFNLGYALTLAACLAHKLNQVSSIIPIANEIIDLADQYNLPLWRVVATLEKGWAKVKMGEADALNDIEQSNHSIGAVMSGISLLSLNTLIDALCHLNKYEAALVLIIEAKQVMAKLGDHHIEAEIYRLEGECLLARAEDSLAESCFNQAIEISRIQQARLYELRASTSLSKLYFAQAKNDQAKYNKAKQSLEGIYNKFTEGLDTPDLQEAQHLLQKLKNHK
ncbi:MAG: BTAD domain-containing putative transcriptional regulator [Pseudomonadota bacterium]